MSFNSSCVYHLSIDVFLNVVYKFEVEWIFLLNDIFKIKKDSSQL